jgi:hypothetical protein
MKIGEALAANEIAGMEHRRADAQVHPRHFSVPSAPSSEDEVIGEKVNRVAKKSTKRTVSSRCCRIKCWGEAGGRDLRHTYPIRRPPHGWLTKSVEQA